MIHSSEFKPRIFPIYIDGDPVEIDRLQDITGGATLNRTKIEEVGRDGLVDWRKAPPAVSLTLRQLEYGNLEFFRQLANKGASVSAINFTDFKTPAVDIAGYETDDDGTFLGTVYYPGYRLSGFGLAIGNPDALVERSFTLIGEDQKDLRKSNKYLIYKRYVISTGGNDKTISISDPTPVADPDASGRYLFKVVKSSGGTHTKLNHGTQWSYDGAGTLTINGASSAGDVIRVWYSGGSYISGEEPFVLNDADLAGITADSCTIYLESTQRIYRLQSVAIDTSFDRFDIREIGDKDTVARGVRDITHRVTLGRILEDYTPEEILRGKAGTDYGIIDIRELSDELNLVIKIYENNKKSTFKIGYKLFDLAPVGIDAGIPVNDYVSRGITLEGEIGVVTTVEGVI